MHWIGVVGQDSGTSHRLIFKLCSYSPTALYYVYYFTVSPLDLHSSSYIKHPRLFEQVLRYQLPEAIQSFNDYLEQ
jgi:hypothetical protein